MAERDRSALGVHDAGVDLPQVDAGQGLHRERLVELDRADVVPGDAGALQRLVRRLDGGDAEGLWVERVRAAAGDAGERRAAEQVGCPLAAQHDRGGAVVERGGVAGGDGAVGAEGGHEAGQRLGGGTGPDALVAGEVDAGHGHDQVVVEAVGPGRVGPRVRLRSERVLACPRDAEALDQLLVRLAQRHRPLGGHALVDQAPAERRRHRGEVSGREALRRFGSTHGARVMDSTPPATTTSASPTSMLRDATIAASREDPHRRLTVVAGTDVGSPASSAAMRPTLRLSSPAWLAQPQTTSPMRSRSRSGVRARTADSAVAARSSGRTSASAPPKRPNGVRAEPYRKEAVMSRR